MYYEKTDNSDYDIFDILYEDGGTMGQVHIIGGKAFFKQFYYEVHNVKTLRQIADFVEEIQQLIDNQKEIAQ